eukprot:TRINITY_DN24469_c0_g1_i2.p1 TRINITY_DN24469_c0_g1~~TRINITY_DN24469_c0_g1_i2.p1  ORF type:complete len:469 (+),score=46.86 TRINITY_DN24469_c0_g1_i2:77-1483(+)
MDDDTLKHLKVHARSRRFEKNHYGGSGATLRKADRRSFDSQGFQLDITRPENEEFLMMSTAVDELYGIAVSRPHGLSQIELLDFFNDLMEEYPSQESVCHGMRVTAFRVPATGWEPGMKTAARQKARFDRLQLGVGGEWQQRSVCLTSRYTHYVQTKACKIVGCVSDAPLDYIAAASLLDKHCRTTASASAKGTRPQDAHINNSASSSCWSPPLSDFQSHYLQVDLGADCDVTYISTQGRFPPLLSNPYNPICEFTGAQIMNETHDDMHQWVWKYSVSARVNGGRTWHSLGVFDGNRDMTTEVAHKLLTPLKCRYLRFRILGFDRKPAMRVGVYGQRPGGSARTQAVEEQTVEYRFEYVAPGVQMNCVPNGAAFAMESYRDRYWRDDEAPKHTRHRRRLAAAGLVPEGLAVVREQFGRVSKRTGMSMPIADVLTAAFPRGGVGRLTISDLRGASSSCQTSDGESWIVL